MLDPTLLRSFDAVVQTRSFTEAASRLRLAQSTISGHVARLERVLRAGGCSCATPIA